MTEVNDARRRTLRTVIQTVVAVVVVAPVLVEALGVDKTAGVGAAIVAVTALIARLMAIPEVNAWLKPWLQK